MKKRYTIAATTLAGCAMIALTACNNITCKNGSGKLISETRKVSNFTKIDISGGFDVVIKQDSIPSLTITADDNLMKYIKSEIDGDKLEVDTKGSVCSSGKFVLNISVRDLSMISTSGAVQVNSTGKITAKDIDIDMSGASKITLDLNANKVNTTSSGMAELNLTGQASSHHIDMSGSGKVNALNFIVAKYDIESSGMSSCKINVLNSLQISSSGTSDIEYRGNPTNIKNDKSGVSTLKKVD